MQTAQLITCDQTLMETLTGFFKSILNKEDIHALLIPHRLPNEKMVMPMLISDPEKLDGIDPFSLAFPVNAARIVSHLTGQLLKEPIAVVLRSCEIRAFVELVKLKQGDMDQLTIIGMDCMGALQNKDYFQLCADGEENISFDTRIEASFDPLKFPVRGVRFAPACRVCEYPIPDQADIGLGVFGMDISKKILVTVQSPKGEKLINALALEPLAVPEERVRCIKALTALKRVARDEMFEETQAKMADFEKLAHYFSHCVNCYNCRVACPVCYCRECVFSTDVFHHEPFQYLSWANRKGRIKLPTDTLFFHLTRLSHMSTACVGCGQCSNACPNDIPIMEIFRTVAHQTQDAFHYAAGLNLEQKPPLSEFKEEEFEDVVGIG